MAYRRRRYAGKRKFRALAKEADDYVKTFIPRRMELMPDSLRIKLPIFYQQTITIMTNRFPCPIYRTVDLSGPVHRWENRHVMDTATDDAALYNQEFPNSHYSKDHPNGVSAEYLNRLSLFYSTLVSNGSKVSLTVSAAHRSQTSVSFGATQSSPGIPIDCWLGCPATVAELKAISAKWEPLRTVLSPDPTSVYSEDHLDFMGTQLNYAVWNAKRDWGTDGARTYTTQAGSPWYFHATEMNAGTRPDLTYLMRELTSEAPGNYRHFMYRSQTSDSVKTDYMPRATFVHNPYAYWQEFIKKEVTNNTSVEVNPQEMMDAIRTFNLGVPADVTTYDNMELSSTKVNGSVTATGTSVSSGWTTSRGTITRHAGFTGYNPVDTGDAGTSTVLEVLPHAWIMLVPRVLVNVPGESWTWPLTTSYGADETEALGAYSFQGCMTVTFGIRVKYYCIFTNRRNGYGTIDDIVPS
jgi:hypothetical protein